MNGLPHRGLVEFLASRCPSEADATRRLTALGLPPPMPGSFERMRQRELSTAPRDVRGFLEGQLTLDSLEPLWLWSQDRPHAVLWAREKAFKYHEHPDGQYMQQAWDVLVNPAYKNVLDAAMLQQYAQRRKLDLPDLNDILNMRFGFTLNEHAFKLYQRFIFNPAIARKAHWKHCLGHADPTRQEMLLLAMQETDQARMRYKLGAPPRFNYAELLAGVMAESLYAFKGAALDNKPQEARAWAKLLMDAGDRREKYGAKDTADLRRDIQLEFRLVENDFPTADELID